MRAVLSLEFIGENVAAASALMRKRLASAGADHTITDMFHVGGRPWVARITGRDPTYGFARTFIRGQIDYSQANGTGSRGVYLYFALPAGVYEVYARISWQRSRRYFIRVVGTTITEITREEVEAWLANADSASLS